MIRNKNLALAALTLAFVGGTVSQSMAQQIDVAISPTKSRYARGERINVVVVVRDWWGYRCPGAAACLQEDITSVGITRWSAIQFTNRAGETRFAYTVPTNTSYDNIYFTGWGNVYGNWAPSQRLRLPIGR
ncbi:MAG: hypothetical protein K1X67_00325 [Fimbriimonadaceae bacterium]|nr:hypothetical protein [Fimbriimonadaceae bacterium]